MRILPLAPAKSVLALSLMACTFAGLPVSAQDTGLACMAQQCTQEERGSFVTTGQGVDNATSDLTGLLSPLMAIARRSLEICSSQQGWTAYERESAFMYEMSRLGEIALRASATFVPDDLERFDRALSTQDTTRLWLLIESKVLSTLANEADELSVEDRDYIGQFMVDAGLVSADATRDEGRLVGERIGVLLALIAVQRLARDQFDGAIVPPIVN